MTYRKFSVLQAIGHETTFELYVRFYQGMFGLKDGAQAINQVGDSNAFRKLINLSINTLSVPSGEAFVGAAMTSRFFMFGKAEKICLAALCAQRIYLDSLATLPKHMDPYRGVNEQKDIATVEIIRKCTTLQRGRHQSFFDEFVTYAMECQMEKYKDIDANVPNNDDNNDDLPF